MAKIVYGLSGEGSGHSSRSREMISHLFKQNPNVSLAFTAEAETSLTGAPNTWTTYYQSAIAFGKAELVFNLEERQKGMNAFQKHYTGRFMDFSERDLKKIMLIKIKITEMTGKANLPEDKK